MECHAKRFEGNDDINLCPGENFITKCTMLQCLRLPGEPCKPYPEDEFGDRCVKGTFCGCDNKCVVTNGLDYKYSAKCMAKNFGKRIYSIMNFPQNNI